MAIKTIDRNVMFDFVSITDEAIDIEAMGGVVTPPDANDFITIDEVTKEVDFDEEGYSASIDSYKEEYHESDFANYCRTYDSKFLKIKEGEKPTIFQYSNMSATDFTVAEYMYNDSEEMHHNCVTGNGSAFDLETVNRKKVETYRYIISKSLRWVRNIDKDGIIQDMQIKNDADVNFIIDNIPPSILSEFAIRVYLHNKLTEEDKKKLESLRL